MSLANTTQLETLEYRYEQMRLALQQQAQIVSGLQSALANQQQGGYANPGGGGTVYFLNAIAIGAGGSVTGQTIYVNMGGVQTATAYTAATVYNEMASATVATSGKIIIVGLNPDNTWSVITQSC